MSKKTVFAILLLMGIAGCKTSGDVRVGKDPRVNDDPTGIKTLDAPPTREPVTSSGATNATKASQQDLERQLEILQGELENQRFQIEKERQEWALRNIESEAEKQKLQEALQARSLPVAATAPSANPEADKNTAELLWNQGVDSIKKNADADALVSMKSLLSNYPKSKRVWGANLTAGMLEYRMKNYKGAAIHFNQAIDMSAKRSVGPSLAWYFQALSFLKMDKKEDASLFFGELDRRFAKTPANTKAKRIVSGKAKAPNDLFADIPNWLDFVGP